LSDCIYITGATNSDEIFYSSIFIELESGFSEQQRASQPKAHTLDV